jgi:hypothetical protein
MCKARGGECFIENFAFLIGNAVFLTFLLVANASAAPSLEQLEGILDRAITMMGAFIGDGVPFTPGFDDNLLLLQKVLSIPP